MAIFVAFALPMIAYLIWNSSDQLLFKFMPEGDLALALHRGAINNCRSRSRSSVLRWRCTSSG